MIILLLKAFKAVYGRGFLPYSSKKTLLDEAQDIHKKDLKSIKKYLDNGYLKSVVFVSKKEDSRQEIEKLAGDNIFKVGTFDKKEAIELVRKRIGDLKFLSDSAITKIFNADKNPRAFLKNCEDVCRYAFGKEAKAVADNHVKEALK